MPFPTTLPAHIQTVEDLQNYLLIATQLEHATLPIYFTALYSINPKTNSDAYHIFRVVAVEEMLHLAQSANLLLAIGGAVKFTDPGFVAKYPTPLPDGELDFYASLQSFSPASLLTCLQIERPNQHPTKKLVPITAARTAARASSGAIIPSVTGGADGDAHFYSIGDFYEEISNGIQRLHAEQGDALFSHNVGWQVSGDDYYSGGGKLTVVTDLDSALDAINRVIYQGEGKDGGIFTKDGELSHYYRFNQLKLGAYYQPGDNPDAPSGPKIHVDWFDVVQVKTNITLEDFNGAPELQQLALNFIDTYADFLATLQAAFSGSRGLLQQQAVPKMFQLRNAITNIINNPLPSDPGLNAAPLFKG